MKFFALKDIPNGSPAGQLFEATPDEGQVLISFGIAREATDAERAGHSSAAPAPGRHRRRDLRPED